MALVQFVDDSAPYLNAQNLNNNFNYLDEKMDVEDLTIPNSVRAITINSSSSYFKRSGNIYNLSIRGAISSGVSANTEYRVFTYNFNTFGTGIITYTGDTSFAGTFIINQNGLYVNFSSVRSEGATIALNLTWIA